MWFLGLCALLWFIFADIATCNMSDLEDEIRKHKERFPDLYR